MEKMIVTEYSRPIMLNKVKEFVQRTMYLAENKVIPYAEFALLDSGEMVNIRSVKLQLDSMIALANTSAMQDHLQSKIDDLTNSLKLIVDNGNLVKMQMINKIQQIENDNRREILIRKYIKFESIVKISKEMFISRQGIYYHLELGEKEIEKLI